MNLTKPTPGTEAKSTRWLDMLLVSAIILLAAFLRLYRLDQLPPGLHYDEAFKGVEARYVLAGASIPIFFPENFGELPLRTYATALNFALFGDSPWSLRLVSAFGGILMVAALYALARDLSKSRWIASLAAFILAILYWQLNFSRLGMEPILTPLTLTLAFAFLWHGIRSQDSVLSTENKKKGGAWYALSGFFFGLTMYTYQAALFVPGLMVAILGVEWVVNREYLRRHIRGLVILALAALIVAAPLGLYFLANPAQLMQRPSDVTVPSSNTTSVADNVLLVAGMFFVRGDANPRSNLPYRPVFDPFLAVGFVAGLVVCAMRLRRPEFRMLFLWFIVMLLPSILTDFAPHFGRTIGVIPAAVLISAFGFGWLAPRIPAPRWALIAVLIVGLGSSALLTVRDYFGVWGSDTGLFDSFDAGYLQLAQALHARPANESIYLSPVSSRHYTIQYGLDGREARSFDGRNVLVLPPPGVAAAYGIATREDPGTIARLRKIFPEGSVIQSIPDWTGGSTAAIFRAQGAPQLPAYKPIRARLGDRIELVAYDLRREQEALALTAQWGSIAETSEDYTVFVHLVGPPNPSTQTPIWAQEDVQPGHGSYPTSRWQPGEAVIDEYRLAIPAGLPAGNYQIELGMYNYATSARLGVTDANGALLTDDRVLLGEISLP